MVKIYLKKQNIFRSTFSIIQFAYLIQAHDAVSSEHKV